MFRFIVHAGIWDVVLLLIVGAIAVLYFVLWVDTAWQERKKKQ